MEWGILLTRPSASFPRCLDVIEMALNDPFGTAKQKDPLETTVAIMQNFMSNRTARMLFGVKARMQLVVDLCEVALETFEPASNSFNMAVRMMWLLLYDNFNLKGSFANCGGITVLRGAIRKCKNLHIPAMHSVIRVFCCLVTREDLAELVASEGIVSDVVLSLRTHADDPEVLRAAFTAVAYLVPFVQNRHQHISIVSVATLQRHPDQVDVVDIGCNVMWRLGLLGSYNLLVEGGVKELLGEILNDEERKKACKNAVGCYWYMKSLEPKEKKVIEVPNVAFPSEKEIDENPLAALDAINDQMAKLAADGSIGDKVEAQAALVQILGHEKVSEGDLDKAWELLNKVDANDALKESEQLLPNVEGGGDGILGESSMNAESLAEIYKRVEEEEEEDEEGEGADGEEKVTKPPFRTGLAATMMWQTPQHIRGKQPDVEALYRRPPNLKRDLYMYMAQRKGGMRKVVYDIRTAGSLGKGRPRGKTKFVRKLKPYYTLDSPKDNTLIFESRFESGNLLCAIRTGEFEYDLVLRPDYRTEGHTQWFYFRVGNTRKGVKYRFTLINYAKAESLYNEGLKPLLYSDAEAKAAGIGWHRFGDEILYFTNYTSRCSSGNPKKYMTLHFTCSFPHTKDTCYLAHAYPYTYTDLQRSLEKMMRDPARSLFVERDLLCKTLAGNRCEVLTIEDPADSEEFRVTGLRKTGKRCVVISARVHPGETAASFMMEGVLDFLTGPSVEAEQIRKIFTFKIIPMLNPDGVVVGNSRCSLAGVDLNRRYRKPAPKLVPTIYHLKSLLYQLQLETGVFMFCDLHAHSRKQNIFMYGCCAKRPTGLTGGQDAAAPCDPRHVAGEWSRAFPFIFSQQHSLFSYQNSHFSVTKTKGSTGRVVVWHELGVANSFTLEASFCGAAEGPGEPFHYHIGHLTKTGRRLCKTILLCSKDENMLLALQQIRDEWRAKRFQQKVDTGVGGTDMSSKENSAGDFYIESDSEEESAGSDSDPSGDNCSEAELVGYDSDAELAPPPPPKPAAAEVHPELEPAQEAPPPKPRRSRASRETLRKRREAVSKRDPPKETRLPKGSMRPRVASARERVKMEDAERVRCDALRNVVLDGNSHANWNKFMMPHYHYSIERQKRAELQKATEEASPGLAPAPTPIAMALKAPTVFNFNTSMFPPVREAKGSAQLRMDRSLNHSDVMGPRELNFGATLGSLNTGGQTLGASLGASSQLGQGGSPLNLGSTMSISRRLLDTHGPSSASKQAGGFEGSLSSGCSVSPPPLRTRLSALGQPTRARSSTLHQGSRYEAHVAARSNSPSKSPVRSSSGPGLAASISMGLDAGFNLNRSPSPIDAAFGNMADPDPRNMGHGGFGSLREQPLMQPGAWTREAGLGDRSTPPENSKMASSSPLSSPLDRQINSMLHRSRSTGPRMMGQP